MALNICPKRQSILQAAGHVLVLGGPGSGKTTIALLKALTRIRVGLEKGQGVLFLSFSRAAVARIAEASKTQVPQEARGLLVIQTFHSFFWEILRAHGYLLGSPKRLEILLPYDERAVREGRQDENADWVTERERLFRVEGRVAFDLFAPKAFALLSSCALLRTLVSSRYPMIILDEAQDTAEDQWRCVQALATGSQLICLADLDQQIYDFRPGVTAERVTQIATSLTPLTVDLGADNNRSPHAEIVQFGNDVLLNTPRGGPYRGVSRIALPRRADERDRWIRQSVGILLSTIKRTTGHDADNLALLASWNKGVTVVSKALRGTHPSEEIHHQVHFDETEVFLASRVVAFCLEPKRTNEEKTALATLLDLMAAVFKARGSKTALREASRLTAIAQSVRLGKSGNRSPSSHSLSMLRKLATHQFLGDPGRDWLFVRSLFRDASTPVLRAIEGEVQYLMAFNRGRRISAGLRELWQNQGSYAGARVVLDSALAEDQLLSGVADLRGINVMTIHKAKGKEFDGVVIIDDAQNCPLIYPSELSPFLRARKLFRVAITRARHHIVLLTDVVRPCSLLTGHSL